MKGIALALTIGSLAAGVFAGPASAPFTPAPGHEKLPVLFWAHYMPQIPNTFLGSGYDDCFPFITAEGDPVAQMKEQITYALNDRIGGFQMLVWPDPRMYEAARKVYAETGRLFYVNPQWCDQGEDFDKAVEQMGKFAVEHKDDPHIFRIDGKQVHFFYGSLKWAGNDQSKLLKAKELIKAKGVEVLFIPEATRTDKLLLDRMELNYGNWPFLKKPEPGPFKWLAETKWDGIDSWGPGDTPYGLAKMMIDRLKMGPNKDFIYMPEIWPGYDSSNRPAQAIHCPHYGVKVLHDNLNTWVKLGIRQFDFVTWNDMNETMVLPSTRSPFGFSEISRYYYQLATDGTSPFDEPKAVVSYDPETLYGDELYFQFLIMPEKGAFSSDYICQVRLEDQNGREAALLTTRSSVPDETNDALSEARMDTTPLIGNTEILSPVVDIYRTDRASNERKTIYSGLRLPPITLRCNKIQFFTCYAIAIDKIDKELSLSIDAKDAKARSVELKTGSVLPIKATYEGKEPLRRLTLAEGRLTRGTFRADDLIIEGKMKAFLKLKSSKNVEVKLDIPEGTIFDRYAIHWDAARVLKGINASSFEGPTAPYEALKKDVGSGSTFRVEAPADAKINLSLKGEEKPILSTSLSKLASGPLTLQASFEGQPLTVRMELSLDAVEPNFNYPLPEKDELVRYVNVDKYHDDTRYFHAWALTKSDKIAYSKPLVLIRKPVDTDDVLIESPEVPVNCQFIRTRGIFDDFVDSSSSSSRNPFDFSDVASSKVEARQVPYILLDFEEGAGTQLNDSGTGHQIGRAWLSGDYEWIKDGWRGSAIRLKGGKIEFRSKSTPHGSYTFSARLRVKERSAAETPIAGDGDFWQGVAMEGLRIDILPDGRIKASRKIRDCEGEATSIDCLKTNDWNHLVVTHDLKSIKIYLDGKLSGEGPVSKPGYMRTHSTPTVGFSKVDKDKRPKGEPSPSFNGDIDQLEIIGTALDARSISKLYKEGQWMAR